MPTHHINCAQNHEFFLEFFFLAQTHKFFVLGQTGRISNDSVSTKYVVPCGTWAAYHPWWRDVYLKLTCNLSSAHAVSETATPLGHRETNLVDVKNSVMRKQRKTCLASLLEVCLSCTWAFDCPLCPLVFGSAVFSARGDMHLLDLIFIPVPFVLPPPFEGMFDVVLPVTPAPCCVRLRGIHCCSLEKGFRGSCLWRWCNICRPLAFQRDMWRGTGSRTVARYSLFTRILFGFLHY